MSEKMNYTVIGAGHGGKAMAAHLALVGRRVTLYNRTYSHIEVIASRGGIDLVLLDPPFDSDLIDPALQHAATRLNAEGKIYAEFGTRPDLGSWHILREGRAGLSHFCLLEPA